MGIVSQGTPPSESDERITIPADKIDPGEFVFRIAGDVPQLALADRDLLIVEPRRHGEAATGEFVIATIAQRVFVGRFWTKHGARALLDDAFEVIAQGPEFRVLGAVTLILRRETH